MVRVVVVGGGVNGVGSALAILHRLPECDLTIITQDLTPNTTGDGAAGFWGPYLSFGTPPAKIIQWSQETWKLFSKWYKSDQPMGVSLVYGESICRDPLPLEPWRHLPLAYRQLNYHEYTKHGPEYR
ncbi:D-amino-acid oxidase-like [Homarus americanus]|uniref:D-amino-acid oxidase-like n=2 Tax=Homarus americanus TaxID=6706 RepID=A0A8J5NCT5_HOMAM|nr:D-amino-acid oxidase-like [Homarus americanus]XP_042222104.1 D-amino-acid oxidase-like [Homarus americanus]KAG7176893.1 D-amino-acid oxidase-like [Homarus americanus]